jgi:hypothetical protein
MMAIGEETNATSGGEEELPTSDLAWKNGHDNVTEGAGVGNDTPGNGSEVADTKGNSTNGSGTFPTLPLQIPRQPSSEE